MTTSPSDQIVLRGYQVAAVEAIIKGFQEYDRQLAVMPTGCHAPGHPILMADGSIRPVEEMAVGEQVMGPDSTPRTVLQLHSGTDEMFRVVPTGGEPFVVNAGHILHLRRRDRPSEFCEIAIRDYLDQPAEIRELWGLNRVAPGMPEGGEVIDFAVERAGAGKYFGFTLDGDHLYLDGHHICHHNSGKTILFAKLAQHYQPRRTLVLAHREELIDQAVAKIHTATGLFADVEMAERRASMHAPVVVASVASMQGERLARWPQHHFGLVVADEAHHCVSDTWQNTLRHFHENALVLGVSATPDRVGVRQLGGYFTNVAYEIGLLDLIKQNWLSPIRVKTVPLGLDLRGVRTTAGDYNADDLAHTIEPYMERIADVLAEHRERRILVFLPLVSVSQQMAELCRERGMAAEHIDGKSPDRGEILERFRRDETRVLTNAMLLVEGVDIPSIDCVAFLRPTKVRSLYAQAVGRGTRIWPGKDHLLILDFLWLCTEHSLVRPASLIARDAEEVQEISEALGGDGDLEAAREAVVADRTRRLAERLAMNARRPSRVFDVLEFAVGIADPDLVEFAATMAWHSDPVSSKQAEILARGGIDPATVRCKGQASAIIDKLFLRRQLGLATAKQVRWLRRLGHGRPELATFDEARAFLDERFDREARA